MVSRKHVLMLGAVSLVCIGGAYSLIAAEPGKKTFGPYECPACTLGMPMPDPGTTAFISKMNENVILGEVTGDSLKMVAGDKIMICNGSECGTYTRSDDVQPRYQGSGRIPRTHTGGGVPPGARPGPVGPPGYLPGRPPGGGTVHVGGICPHNNPQCK